MNQISYEMARACHKLAGKLDRRAIKATDAEVQSGQYGNWCHDSEILKMAARVFRRECCADIPENLYIEQAKAAIKQGQSLNDFVLHAHYAYRPQARKAYLIASKNQ